MTEEKKIEIEATIPIKFNKESKNLTVGEASLLAQKGMKFDLIKDDFERLKKIAQTKGKNVPLFLQELENTIFENRKAELLEKCSGDENLVEKIISMEQGYHTEKSGFNELKEYFPKITSEDMLPDSVTESSKLKGTLLLDEYLRYLLAQKKRQEKSIKFQEKLQNLSIGSLQSFKSPISPESEEFIKGLWK